jgi:peroxiredoxin
MFTTRVSSLVNHQLRKVVMSQSKSISTGTDLLSSSIVLHKAHPWYESDAEGSNLAADNAVSLKDLFENKTVAVFAVPAPFTGTCTLAHYPGYKENADAFLKSGCDEIVCLSVSDPYANAAWAKSMGNDDSKIKFYSDPDGAFIKAHGLEMDAAAVSLGSRSQRFSMIVKNGKVSKFRLVDDAVADAKTLLEELSAL